MKNPHRPKPGRHIPGARARTKDGGIHYSLPDGLPAGAVVTIRSTVPGYCTVEDEHGKSFPQIGMAALEPIDE